MPEVSIGGKQIAVPKEKYNNAPQLLASLPIGGVVKSMVDPYQVSKIFGIGIIMLISGLLVLDFIILRRRGVFRISSYHFSHLSLMAVTGMGVLMSTPGAILCRCICL